MVSAIADTLDTTRPLTKLCILSWAVSVARYASSRDMNGFLNHHWLDFQLGIVLVWEYSKAKIPESWETTWVMGGFPWAPPYASAVGMMIVSWQFTDETKDQHVQKDKCPYESFIRHTTIVTSSLSRVCVWNKSPPRSVNHDPVVPWSALCLHTDHAWSRASTFSLLCVLNVTSITMVVQEQWMSSPGPGP